MSKPKINKSIQIPDQILRKLLTASEWRMLKNRYQIMSFLEEGLSIRAVASKVRVGTDTVVRISRINEKGNLKRIRAKKLPFKTSTPWIFGKKD